MLDKADQIGVDTLVPPRFDCEKCPGKMEPKSTSIIKFVRFRSIKTIISNSFKSFFWNMSNNST